MKQGRRRRRAANDYQGERFMTTRIKTRLRQAFGAPAIAAAAALMLAGGAAAFAASTAPTEQEPQQQEQQRRRGPGGPGGGMHGMRGPGGPGFEFRGLDLSDDQRAQLRKIREARQSEFKAAGEKLRAAREGMRTLIEADSINEPAIRAKSQEVAAAEAEFAILNAKVRAESMQILTSEQQAKLKERRENRQQRQPRKRSAQL
jgi:protein CpxP